MKRNKYVNTFNTTSEFNNYIESAEPGFPNVALTKDTGDIHYTQTSPISHVIYGELVDVNGTIPVFMFNNNNNQKVTAHIDTLNGTFYVDASDMAGVTTPITNLQNFIYNNSSGAANIKTIKKMNFNTSSVTKTLNAFLGCNNLILLDLSSWDLSSVTDQTYMFNLNASSIKDVIITYESTLNKLTNNLSSQGNGKYIPSSATIHYNGTDYKWQNNAWTAQS